MDRGDQEVRVVEVRVDAWFCGWRRCLGVWYGVIECLLYVSVSGGCADGVNCSAEGAALCDARVGMDFVCRACVVPPSHY